MWNELRSYFLEFIYLSSFNHVLFLNIQFNVEFRAPRQLRASIFLKLNFAKFDGRYLNKTEREKKENLGTYFIKNIKFTYLRNKLKRKAISSLFKTLLPRRVHSAIYVLSGPSISSRRDSEI